MIRPGTVALAILDPTKGTEQAGTRPVIVIGGPYNWDSIIIVVPLSTTNRGWGTHVAVMTNRVSYALCEQVRAISTSRVTRELGVVSNDDLAEVQQTTARLIGVY